MVTVDDVAGYLRARAAELDALAEDHRAGHGRRESKSVRLKYAAQARELRRVLAWLLAEP